MRKVLPTTTNACRRFQLLIRIHPVNPPISPMSVNKTVIASCQSRNTAAILITKKKNQKKCNLPYNLANCQILFFIIFSIPACINPHQSLPQITFIFHTLRLYSLNFIHVEIKPLTSWLKIV